MKWKEKLKEKLESKEFDNLLNDYRETFFLNKDEVKEWIKNYLLN